MGHHTHHHRPEAPGAGLSDLVGAAVGLALGLTRGTAVLARRVAEEAVWMDRAGGNAGGGGCHVVHHRCVCEPHSWGGGGGGCGCQSGCGCGCGR